MKIQCPHCRNTGEDHEGDLKMCAECGLWSRREGTTLRRLTPDELEEVAGAFGEFVRTKRDFLR